MVELVSCRVKQQNGNNYGDWLIEKSRQDPVVVHEVTSRLKEVTKPVDDLSRKLSFFKSELDNHLMQQRDFVETVDAFDAKLRKMEDKVCKLRPVSAIYSKARGQHEEFKPVFRDVQNMKKTYESVIEQKEKIEKEYGTSPLEDSEDARMKKVPELDRRWKLVWDTVTKYHIQITTVLPYEEIYHYAVMKFAPWLEDTEKKVKQIEMRPLSKPEEIEQTNVDIKVCMLLPMDYCTIHLTNLRNLCLRF